MVTAGGVIRLTISWGVVPSDKLLIVKKYLISYPLQCVRKHPSQKSTLEQKHFQSGKSDKLHEYRFPVYSCIKLESIPFSFMTPSFIIVLNIKTPVFNVTSFYICTFSY